MKPEYYIYSWQAGAFRSDELSKSLKGYSCRDTAERIAKFRFNEMTRQNMPNTYYGTDDAEKCHKCERFFSARLDKFENQFCITCLSNRYVEEYE